MSTGSILERGYQTFSTHFTTHIPSSAQVKVLYSNVLQNLGYSTLIPSMKTASKVGLVCFALFCIRYQYKELSGLNERIKGIKDAEDQKELYQFLAPLRNHILYMSKWEQFKKNCLSLDQQQFLVFLERVLDIQIADEKNDWFSPLLENISVKDLCDRLGIEEDIDANIAHAQDVAKVLSHPSLFPERPKGFIKENMAELRSYIYRGVNSIATTILRAHDFSAEEDRMIGPYAARLQLSFYYSMIKEPCLLLVGIFYFLKNISTKPWVRYVGTFSVLMGALGLFKVLSIILQNSKVNVSNELTNLSARAQKGDLPIIIGRGEEVVKLALSLNPLVKDIRWVLLVGPSGSGKDAIVQEFTSAIQKGYFPHLKNAQVTEMNTADLKEIGGGSGSFYLSRIQLLLKEIEGKEDRVVIFLNEIHTLNSMTGQFCSELGQQLKTLSEKKIMFIGATTLDEYKNTIAKDPALDRRFDIIFVQTLKKEDCLEILKSSLIINYPNIRIEDGAIELAYDLTEKSDPQIAQPTKAKNVLEKAIRKIMCNLGMDAINQLKSSKKLEKERARLQYNPTNAVQARLAAAELQTLEEHSKTVQKKQIMWENLQNLYRMRNHLNHQFIASACRVAAIGNRQVFPMDLKKFIFFKNLLSTTLEAKIILTEDQLEKEGMHVKLTCSLVNQIVAEQSKSEIENPLTEEKLLGIPSSESSSNRSSSAERIVPEQEKKVTENLGKASSDEEDPDKELSIMV